MFPAFLDHHLRAHCGADGTGNRLRTELMQLPLNDHHQVRVLAESRHVRGHSGQHHRELRRIEEDAVGLDKISEKERREATN